MLLGSQAHVANKVRCLAWAKGRQKYDRGGLAIEGGYSDNVTGRRETWDSTNTFLSSCLLLFEPISPSSSIEYMRWGRRGCYQKCRTKSAASCMQPLQLSRHLQWKNQINGHLKGKDVTSAGTPDSRTLKLSSLVTTFQSTKTIRLVRLEKTNPPSRVLGPIEGVLKAAWSFLPKHNLSVLCWNPSFNS